MNVSKIVIFGITIIFCCTLYAPLLAQNERGFVSGAAMNNPSNNKSFGELIEGAYQSLQVKNYEKAYLEFKLALQDVSASKYRNADEVNWQAINSDFGMVCDTLGTRLLHTGRHVEAIRYFVEATMPYLKADNQEAVLDITKKMAQISLATNPAPEKYDNAIKKYQDFLTFRRIKDIDLIAQAHYEIAVLYAEKGEREKGVNFLQESIKNFDKEEEKIAIYRQLANFYKYLRENKGFSALIYEEATNFLKEEIEKTSDHQLKANLYLIKADFELKRGKSGSFYKDYTSAINLFQEDNNPLGAANTCIKAAQTLYEAAEYSKAKAYLEEGKKLITSIKSKNNPEVKHTTMLLQDMLADIQRREKLEAIEGKAGTLDEQLEEQQRQFLIIISLVLMSALVFVGISFYNARKNNKLLHRKNIEIYFQKEQISQQHNNIVKQKDELETSYRNISLLSEIGQKITATLEIDSVVHLVHECFSGLVSTDVFAVGVYNPTIERVNFIYHVENGAELSEHSINLQRQENQFVAKCIKSGRELLLSDEENVMKSQLFLPLSANNKVTGLIIVKSKKANVYSKRDLNLLKALASYTSVALANANAYQIIENKNKHITDSLRYGKTIQQALLPSKEKLESVFKESFIFFRPKDIVSGDFYWFSTVYNKNIVAAVDCTGHGVPGAFMSMIGHTLLNEIVNQNKITDPAQILGLLHTNIRKALNQSAESGSANDDGMDAAICVVESISDEQSKITFAGAKRPLVYIPYPHTEVKHIRGDRKSIGGLQKEEYRVFNNHELILNKNSLIYLFTDGYPDQNGIDKGSFSTKRFENLLLQHASEPLATQKEILRRELALHQQEAEQRDDITIIGIRV